MQAKQKVHDGYQRQLPAKIFLAKQVQACYNFQLFLHPIATLPFPMLYRKQHKPHRRTAKPAPSTHYMIGSQQLHVQLHEPGWASVCKATVSVSVTLKVHTVYFDTHAA